MIGAFFQDNLVHCFPGGIKHLYAAPYPCFAVTLNQKCMFPVAGKNAQVDVVRQDHRGMSARMIVIVRPDLFMNARRVSRQSHHFAQLLGGGHNHVGISCNPGVDAETIAALIAGLYLRAALSERGTANAARASALSTLDLLLKDAP